MYTITGRPDWHVRSTGIFTVTATCIQSQEEKDWHVRSTGIFTVTVTCIQSLEDQTGMFGQQVYSL